MKEFLRSTRFQACHAGFAMLGVFLALYAWLPYSAGYLEKRSSILGTAIGLWSSYPDWQHGALVPFITAFTIWWQRKRLAGIPMRGSWWGLLILSLSCLVYWLGYLVDHYYLGFASAQIFLAGVVIFFLGWRMMWALAFPWLFLCFTWPILYLDNLIAFPLRILMSSLSYQSLTLLGVPVVRSGTAILSAPDYLLGVRAGERFAVDIADPCSGIHSLFALMMVSALYGYFSMPKVWQRYAIFAASVPLAILGNLARILLLTFGTLLCGSTFAIGTPGNPSIYHMLAGYIVFVVALLGMLALGWAVQVNWPAAFQNFQNARKSIAARSRPARIPASPSANASDIY